MIPTNPFFTIGIPTLNRWDLLRPSLQLYVNDFPGTPIVVIDNGKQVLDFKHPNITYLTEEKNIGVSASWNKLCYQAFINNHSPFALILNDDIYLSKKEADLKNVVRKFPRDFYKSLHDDWCVFVLPRKTYMTVGMFDENFFPAYFEDRDYRYRMRIAGLTCMEAVQFNPLVYRNSQSSERDRSLLNSFEKNKRYYIDKWGGEPGREKFKTAFNT